MKKRVKQVSGVISDKRGAARVKLKVVVGPALHYGLETAALIKGQETELEAAELKVFFGSDKDG